MSLGSTPVVGDIFRDTTEFCAPRVRTDSIYALLHRECFSLFPDELFADLFADIGRRSVPPLVVAVVMVLQRLEGLSDREAVERFTFDARWKYAAGGLPFDYPGFAHTVLVDMRARLARSDRPNRIFKRSVEVVREAGLVGVRRVLDSTPLYDAVATMDTVSLVRSAIRGVLGAADDREPQLRAVLRRDDDYRTGGKPACDWEDAEARLALVDALARDGQAMLDAQRWIGSDGAGMVSTLDGGATWVRNSAIGLPGAPEELQMANPQHGWAHVWMNVCLDFKSNCSSRTGLYATADGGSTWTQLWPG